MHEHSRVRVERAGASGVYEAAAESKRRERQRVAEGRRKEELRLLHLHQNEEYDVAEKEAEANHPLATQPPRHHIPGDASQGVSCEVAGPGNEEQERVQRELATRSLKRCVSPSQLRERRERPGVEGCLGRNGHLYFNPCRQRDETHHLTHRADDGHRPRKSCRPPAGQGSRWRSHTRYASEKAAVGAHTADRPRCSLPPQRCSSRAPNTG